MLDKQLMVEYNWTPDYTEHVIYEYMRFMVLRSKNTNLSPSNEIDKCWHMHLLNPIKYYNYCMKTFNNIIDHNPEMSYDQKEKKLRLNNTLVEYKKKYGEFKYPDVWGIYNIKSDDKLEIKLKIVFSLEPMLGTKHLKNSDMLFHEKILTLKCNNKTKISDIRTYIYNEILEKNNKKNKIGLGFDIKIKNANGTQISGGWFNVSNLFNTHANEYILDHGNTFTVLLQEITANGYC